MARSRWRSRPEVTLVSMLQAAIGRAVSLLGAPGNSTGASVRHSLHSGLESTVDAQELRRRGHDDVSGSGLPRERTN